MKLVIQRVKKAKVVSSISKKILGKIESGMFVLFGSAEGDNLEKSKYLAQKLSKLRIMSDVQGKMNLSIKDVAGSILVVSQFTLNADTNGGNRPSFVRSQNPKEAKIVYEGFINELKNQKINVQTGKFGEYMEIKVDLDGPVTILIEK